MVLPGSPGASPTRGGPLYAGDSPRQAVLISGNDISIQPLGPQAAFEQDTQVPAQEGPLTYYPSYSIVDPRHKWQRIHDWASLDSATATGGPAFASGAAAAGRAGGAADMGSPLGNAAEEADDVAASIDSTLLELELERARASLKAAAGLDRMGPGLASAGQAGHGNDGAGGYARSAQHAQPASFNVERTALDARVRAADEALGAAERRHTNEAERLLARISALDASLAAERQLSAQLQEQLQSLDLERRRAVEAVQQAADVARDQSSRLASTEATRAALEKQLQQEKESSARLARQLREAQRQEAALLEKLGTSEGSRQQQEMRLEAAAEQVTAMRGELQLLNAKLSARDKQLLKHVQEVEEMQLAALRSDLSSAHARVAAQEDLTAALRSSLASVYVALSPQALAAAFGYSEPLLAGFSGSAVAYGAVADRLLGQRVVAEEDTAAVLARVKELVAQTRNLYMIAERREVALTAETDQAMSTLRQSNADAEARLASCSTALRTATQHAEELMAHLQESRGRCADLEGALAASRTGAEEARRRCDDLQRALDGQQQEAALLRERAADADACVQFMARNLGRRASKDERIKELRSALAAAFDGTSAAEGQAGSLVREKQQSTEGQLDRVRSEAEHAEAAYWKLSQQATDSFSSTPMLLYVTPEHLDRAEDEAESQLAALEAILDGRLPRPGAAPNRGSGGPGGSLVISQKAAQDLPHERLSASGADLQHTKATAQAEFGRVREEVAKAYQAELASAQTALERAHAELRALQAERAAGLQHITQLGEQLRRLGDDASKWRQAAAPRTRERMTMAAKLKQGHVQLRQLQIEVAQLSSRLQESQANAMRLLQQGSSLREELEDMQRAAEDEGIAAQERLASASREIAERNAVIADLRRQVASAKAAAAAATSLLPAISFGQLGDAATVQAHLVGQLGQLQVLTLGALGGGIGGGVRDDGLSYASYAGEPANPALAAKDQRIQELRTTLAALLAERTVAQRDISTARDQAAAAVAATAQDELQVANQSLDRARDALATAEQQLAAAVDLGQRRLAELEAHQRQAQAELQAAHEASEQQAVAREAWWRGEFEAAEAQARDAAAAREAWWRGEAEGLDARSHDTVATLKVRWRAEVEAAEARSREATSALEAHWRAEVEATATRACDAAAALRARWLEEMQVTKTRAREAAAALETRWRGEVETTVVRAREAAAALESHWRTEEAQRLAAEQAAAFEVQAERAREQLTQVQALHAAAEEAVRLLSAQLRELQTGGSSQAQATAVELQAAQVAADSARRELALARDTVTAHETELRRMQAQHESASGQAKSLATQLQGLSEDLASARTRIGVLQQELGAQQAEVDTLREANGTLQASLAAADDRHADSEAQLVEAEAALSRQQALVRQVQSENERLHGQYGQLQQQLAQLTSERRAAVSASAYAEPGAWSPGTLWEP
ncbi:hypothetical protein TSOC_006663 [Tetrabaena socialis]|uniref:Uncharacterized protein n=1 Tax=Tetrabaena socialis TaxID=47790 RepID=A0A2J8A333_9CHLO|nr:hypothetical protein TSOC_006663 [Tetrabaena socialis]|eukprot:PNH06937.1 hypothetical protein TSOC_006663 [Tetrabaena socialis]